MVKAPPLPPENAAAVGGPPYVGVALDLPVDRIFTYRVPEGLRDRARPGHRVAVPFRGKRHLGVIAEVQATCDVPSILDVVEIPDAEPLLTADLLDLGRFVARYYGSSFGEALAAMVPRGVRVKGKGAVRWRVRLGTIPPADAPASGPPPAPEAEPGPRERILRLLVRHPEGFPLADLCRRARVSESPVKTLARQGQVTLAREESTADELVAAAQAPAAAEPPPVLTAEQTAALARIEEAVAQEAFAPFLLLGVTGSGKTEVYLRAIEACRLRGRQAIVLVPEIALTPQTVRRFRARFERVAVLHSGMTDADRARAWERIRRGQADVVIGPRSAVFAPVPRLGLLVVDEEHEGSFKQQNAPRYNARDVGIVRAKRAGAVAILGSATPQLETWRNALEGRYGLLRLTERPGGRAPPPVQVVDLRGGDEGVSGGRHLSRTLEIRMRETLRDGGQVILLQNRRGFATSVACPRCGWTLRCNRCDVSLVYHRQDRTALCHLCGHEERPPPTCPDCALPGLRYQGAGTQTIEAELAVRFPDAKVARMDSDSMATRESYEDVLGRFERREIDVLVGTQMVAKGLHFPHVTLVGIVNADTSLALPDFRSAERTFALVAQVAGRAGRGDEAGRVVVQTAMPDHPAIRAAAEHDFDGFAAREIEDRRAHGYPPFRRLLRVVLRGPTAAEVEARAEETGRRLAGLGEGVEVLGPSTPTVEKIQGLHRRHLLVKAATPAEIARALQRLRSAPRPKGRVEEIFDVDPVGLL